MTSEKTIKVTIKPTQDEEVMKKNLEKRGYEPNENLEIQITRDNLNKIERMPGIDKIITPEEQIEGLKGRPTQEKAYAKLNTKEQVVKAFLATINGYNLVIINPDRDWDYKILKKYNPQIRRIKTQDINEIIEKELEIEKSLFQNPNVEKIDVPVEEKDIETIYQELMI